MRNELKITGFILFLCFFVTLLFPVDVLAAELPLKAKSAVLLDAHSGKILYEKNAHEKQYPASMTKLMTMILAMEAIKDGKIKMDDVVTASEKAASYGGSQIYLAPGEKLTLKELLLGIALASGNDASVAVAEYIAGTHESFVEMMNKKAAQLGLKNTHFVNSNGLHDPEHYTTAYDFAQVAIEALHYPELLELCSVKHYRIRENTPHSFQFDNKNKLLWQYQGVDGFKTGWTVDAEYCLTATCERNGLRFVSVVMGVPNKSGQFAETKTLFNWGYSQYAFKEFYPANETVGHVSVGKGEEDKVGAVCEKKVGITLPKGEDKDLTVAIDLVPHLDAPVQAGQVVGHVSILQKGEVKSRTNLVAKDSINKGTWWRSFKKAVKSTVIGEKGL